ncbi:MAG: 30S ribosomal protein S12 methylthiotransferase RimO [bacterium]
MRKKIGMVSLGCPKNLVDSEEMLGRLAAAGYELTSSEEEADLILINTCGFIETAKEESIDTILSYCERRAHGGLKGLVVTGCLAQRYAGELQNEIPEVDLFLPLQEEKNIVEVVDRILSEKKSLLAEASQTAHPPQRTILTPFYTAYLKISEGCSNRCTYCAIPLIRGPQKSREIQDLVSEAEDLCSRGVREIILIGQDIARFGRDRDKPQSLIPLIQRLSQIENLTWIRLMYVHPDHLTNELITLMAAEPKIVPYLDLPIQHINDVILKRMNRQAGASTIRERIRKLRETVPGLVLRTTLLAGFPGETEDAFRELCGFVTETRFDHIGAFAYSQEEGTPAAELPDQIADEVKAERLNTILGLQAGISKQRNRERVGTVQKVLVEGTSPETDLLLSGRYYGQAPEIDGLVLINKGDAVVGEFFDVRITDAHEYDLIGEIVE